MGSRSHLGRLEYGCQLDANGGSQWASGYCDFRSFEYHRCLDLGEYRGQRHHVHLRPPRIPTPSPPAQRFTLTISGMGITNNSGITQNFVTAVRCLRERWNDRILQQRHRRECNVSICNDWRLNELFQHSTAGSASIDTGGDFDYSPTMLSGSMNFFNNSTAGSATIDPTSN